MHLSDARRNQRHLDSSAARCTRPFIVRLEGNKGINYLITGFLRTGKVAPFLSLVCVLHFYTGYNWSKRSTKEVDSSFFLLRVDSISIFVVCTHESLARALPGLGFVFMCVVLV